MIATFAPSFANRWAVASPIPLFPPVTIATLPSSLAVKCLPLCDISRDLFGHESPLTLDDSDYKVARTCGQLCVNYGLRRATTMKDSSGSRSGAGVEVMWSRLQSAVWAPSVQMAAVRSRDEERATRPLGVQYLSRYTREEKSPSRVILGCLPVVESPVSAVLVLESSSTRSRCS